MTKTEMISTLFRLKCEMEIMRTLTPGATNKQTEDKLLIVRAIKQIDGCIDDFTDFIDTDTANEVRRA